MSPYQLPPIPPPAPLLGLKQLRSWLAELFGTQTLPCPETIRRLRKMGMPCLALGTRTIRYPAGPVWEWLMGRMSSPAMARVIQPRLIPVPCKVPSPVLPTRPLRKP